uniref:Uncharacterized protein n=1 Tax=Arundo donax TaxID=35708 RepID=A0A0A9H891_ARUDO
MAELTWPQLMAALACGAAMRSAAMRAINTSGARAMSMPISWKRKTLLSS